MKSPRGIASLTHRIIDSFRPDNRTVAALTLLAASVAAAALLYAPQRAHGNRGYGRPPTVVRQFVGGGHWHSQRRIESLSDRDIGSLKKGWQIQMKHFDDDSLSGRVTLMGSPLDEARIEGQVTGTDVDGVLLDDAGHQVGTFSGTIARQGISGTYTTADGDTGDWTWAGRLPN